MSSSNPIELADRISRRRPIGIAIAALYFLAIQPLVHPAGGFVTGNARALTWAVNAGLLLLLLLPATGFIWGRRVRELLHDDVSRLHARSAMAGGFWIAMVAALGVFSLPAADGLTAREALYLVVTPTTVGALLLFAWREWRAHRDG
jgi:hypothetical protein